jgi:glutamine synthetase
MDITDTTPLPAALDLLEAQNIEMIDLRFTDLLGSWQQLSVPLRAFLAGSHATLPFDGSSLRGWRGIEASDMMLKPDLSTIQIDPFAARATASVICDIAHPDGESYDRDPRAIAREAENYLRRLGIATDAYYGPECEFFIFDSVSSESLPHRAGYSVDSSEGYWNSGKEGLGYTIGEKRGYAPASPHDSLRDIRAEMTALMEIAGLSPECHHHEVASGGQCEIDLRYDTLVSMADKVMLYKYIVRNVAKKAGKVATFMPKPIYGDNGSGMHTHISLWNEGETLMFDAEGPAGLSELSRQFLAGILLHAPALLAICAPTTNSYKRLVPGYEAPVNLVYAAANRSAAIRIPSHGASPEAKRIEFRCPDPLANPYLAFSALLMAGIDGIQKGLDPGDPADWDLYEDPRGVMQVPGSLDASLAALKDDHEFLLQGGVFSSDLIETWVALKREESEPMRLRPHPSEFALYFDA